MQTFSLHSLHIDGKEQKQDSPGVGKLNFVGLPCRAAWDGKAANMVAALGKVRVKTYR